MKPGVSVIIPVFNGVAYLAQAIESVLAQTISAQEIIVIDDGSTDGSIAVAQSYARVRCESLPHGGISVARNRGIELAQGEYIALLDADDVWLPLKLEKQVAALEQAAAPLFVFGFAQEFVSPELPPELHERLHCEPEPRPGVLPSALLLARSDFWRVGGFSPQWHVGEFADWVLRANETGLTKLMLPDLLVRRRIHTGNNGIRNREKFNDYARMIKASLERRRAAGQDF